MGFVIDYLQYSNSRIEVLHVLITSKSMNLFIFVSQLQQLVDEPIYILANGTSFACENVLNLLTEDMLRAQLLGYMILSY